MYSPKVSIILPVFNGQDYLKFALDSILNQSYENYELIIVNDGSTDKSELIIKEYNDTRIVYIKHDNCGLSRSLNKAISISKGEYICRMDADDICHKDRLKKQVEILDAKKNLVLVGSNVKYINSNGKIKGYSYFGGSSKYIKSKLEKDNCIFHPTVMIRKEPLLVVGGYDESVDIYFEDYVLWLKLIRLGDFYVIPDFLLDYRIHKDSISNNTPESIHKIIKNYALKGYLTVDEQEEIKTIRYKKEHKNHERKSSIIFKLISSNRFLSKVFIFFRGVFL
ncbi:glycosyltransferase family 2 protein [Vibrio cholerae]|nr:glycosyltransferase [Vibrio cholerae]